MGSPHSTMTPLAHAASTPHTHVHHSNPHGRQHSQSYSFANSHNDRSHAHAQFAHPLPTQNVSHSYFVAHNYQDSGSPLANALPTGIIDAYQAPPPMAPMQKLNLKSIAQTSFVQRSGDTPPSKGSPSASQYMLNYDAQQQKTQPLQSQYQHRVGIMNYFKTQSSHHK